MVKTFCDACGKEIKNSRVYSFTHLCHIDANAGLDIRGYVTQIDGELHSVSGREESSDVCLPCYNKIYSKAFAKFDKIRIENGLIDE